MLNVWTPDLWKSQNGFERGGDGHLWPNNNNQVLVLYSIMNFGLVFAINALTPPGVAMHRTDWYHKYSPMKKRRPSDINWHQNDINLAGEKIARSFGFLVYTMQSMIKMFCCLDRKFGSHLLTSEAWYWTYFNELAGLYWVTLNLKTHRKVFRPLSTYNL